MVINRQRRIAVAIHPLEGFLERVQQAVGFPEHGVTVCLLSDAAMARLNQAFRGTPEPTDVLSFSADGKPRRQHARNGNRRRGTEDQPTRELTSVHRCGSRKQQSSKKSQAAAERSVGLSSGSGLFPAPSSPYLGDIAIALGTARRNARRGGRTLGQELQVLILHGVLHLLGYDHEADQGEMSRLERRLRRQLGLR